VLLIWYKFGTLPPDSVICEVNKWYVLVKCLFFLLFTQLMYKNEHSIKLKKDVLFPSYSVRILLSLLSRKVQKKKVAKISLSFCAYQNENEYL
jgi:hypothetical protein